MTMLGFGFFAVAFCDGDKKPETRHIKHKTPDRSPNEYAALKHTEYATRDPTLCAIKYQTVWKVTKW